MSDSHPTVPLDFERIPEDQMRERATDFYERMRRRRSTRAFSPDPIPMDVVRDAVRTASTAPSGANKQPWTFVVVTDDALKSQIRVAAEEEERKFYEERATDEWLEDLAHLGTDHEKPYLEDAPALIVVFAQRTGPDGGGHYYVRESVGLACGMLIAALHNAGLATLTHTPSPMNFLADILERPEHEKPFLLMPVGYPADDCEVPDIDRKPLEDVLVVMGDEAI